MCSVPDLTLRTEYQLFKQTEQSLKTSHTHNQKTSSSQQKIVTSTNLKSSLSVEKQIYVHKLAVSGKLLVEASNWCVL